ncbi:MAG TPA: hypothetical protein VL049_11925 [Candidatus Dormibacteraeota bacterium]|nr:hypothetical protein [Candidatus Dormibacteraeota bacterium]
MRIPPRVRCLITACCLLALPSLLAAAEAPTTTPSPVPVPTVWSGDKPPFGLTGGADSIDALIDQYIAAITAGDLAALEPLRVTLEEYGSIIVPGMVEKGKQPRTTFEKVNAVFYGMLDSRSRYSVQSLIDRFKGKKIVRHELTFSKPTQEWAWYTAHGEVRLVLFDDRGTRYEMKSGWIAEVNGRFKFIGFDWKN